MTIGKQALYLIEFQAICDFFVILIVI